MVKLDVEARIHKFGIGNELQVYYSKMQNIGFCICRNREPD